MTSRNDVKHLVRRRGVWHYKRRVPVDLASLDRRGTIRKTTGKRDLAEAIVVAARISEELESYWRALAEAGEGAKVSGALDRFEAALRLARRLGVTYRPAAEIAAGPLADVVERFEILDDKGADTSPPVVAAVLGGAERPALRLSDLFAAYERLAGDRLVGKSPDQVRKWRNPRLLSIANTIDVIGDKRLADITRDDALDLRAWWLDRVRDEGYDQGTANKSIGVVATMMRMLDEAMRLGLPRPFESVRIAGERHNPRIAYEVAFVRENFLDGQRLAGMNAEARAIVRMVAATGMRPSEVAALTAPRIILDAAIPHVQIRPEARQLKTRQSARDMPLVGVGLDVMREFREGFGRYRDSPDTLSATVNKALGVAGLRPTPAHTLYSLRHTFKDRLIALEAPERVQDALMGHAVRGIEYGSGPSLAQRAEWLARVWS